MSHPAAAAESRTDTSSIARLSEVLTAGYLEEHRLLPLAHAGDRVVVAHVGSPDPQTLAELSLLFDAPLELREMAEDELLAAVQQVYGTDNTTAAEMIAGLASDAVVDAGDDELIAHDLEGLANQAPVIKLVNLLLAEALEARASDVHLEAAGRGLQVRYRVDGVLQEAPSPPAHLGRAMPESPSAEIVAMRSRRLRRTPFTAADHGGGVRSHRPSRDRLRQWPGQRQQRISTGAVDSTGDDSPGRERDRGSAPVSSLSECVRDHRIDAAADPIPHAIAA